MFFRSCLATFDRASHHNINERNISNSAGRNMEEPK